MTKKAIDISNKTFGRLKVIRRCLDRSYPNGEAIWECICSCAKQSVIYCTGSRLRNGSNKSCGCVKKPEKEEFLKRLHMNLLQNSRINTLNQCLEWIGKKSNDGYGIVSLGINKYMKSRRAHRASWLVYRGDIPHDKYVLHICDNPLCIRIDHLFLGNHSDNMKDMVRKGRNPTLIGSKTRKKYLLSESKVLKILKLKNSTLTTREISKKFGICESYVRAIWQRRTWKHINIDKEKNGL